MSDRNFRVAVLSLLAVVLVFQAGLVIAFITSDNEEIKSLEESITQVELELYSVKLNTQYTAEGIVSIKAAATYFQEKIEKGEIKSEDDFFKFLPVFLDILKTIK